MNNNIAGTAAKGGGEVTSEGGLPVVERGLCWNTAGSPTISDPHTADGEGSGAFSDTGLTDLTEDTLYSARAYAKTDDGIFYGNEVVFNSGFIFGTDHAGGYVFYNDGEGGGYVAAKTNQHAGQVWSNVDDESAGDFVLWDAFYNGPANTWYITEQTGHGTSAAWDCLDYDDGMYDDWYLPSASAMVQMSERLDDLEPDVCNFGHLTYWSSTQASAESAIAVSMSNGQTSVPMPKYDTRPVRAAREF